MTITSIAGTVLLCIVLTVQAQVDDYEMQDEHHRSTEPRPQSEPADGAQAVAGGVSRDGEQSSIVKTTSLGEWLLVLFTATLTAATVGLLLATRHLGKATDAMSAATFDMAQATLQRTRLEYRSRITGDWNFRDENAILTIKDERSMPMRIESIYAGTSHNRTEGENESKRIRMSQVDRSQYDTPLRGEGEPVYVVLPCPVPPGARRIVLQARVSYREHASSETRRREFVAVLHIDPDGTVRLKPSKVGADEGHYPGEHRSLLEEELGMWVPDEGLGG